MNAITFFSYKGGSGRSTTCMNTLPFLAEELGACRNRPILLLDMDIESAGMTYLLGQEQVFQDRDFDVKDLLMGELNFQTGGVRDIYKHELISKFVPVGTSLGLKDNFAVLFLGVNDNSPQINRREAGSRPMDNVQNLYQFCRSNSISAIVMDSAAGDQATATKAISITTKLVCCMRPTHQFRVGTFNYLQRLRNRMSGSAGDIEIVLLPTVVPSDAVIKGKSQLDTSIEEISKQIEARNLQGLNFNKTFVRDKDQFGINEVSRFKWQEDILYRVESSETLSAEEKTAYERYSILAAELSRAW